MRVVTGDRTDPTQVSGPYHTMKGIVEAETWAHPEDLRQYFDVAVTFQGKDYPVNMILKTDTGTVIPNPASFPSLVGTYKAGTAVTKSFPATVVHAGKTYTIQKSWLATVLNPANIISEQPAAADNRQRNFKVPVGGMNMVAQYKAANPVTAKFYATDGTPLQDPVDLGEKETGAAVSYSFPTTLSKDGVTYTITQSYFLYNSAPTTKKFIQNEGSAGLITRNLNTPEGGATIVGIYKNSLCETDPSNPACSSPQGSGDCVWTIQPPSEAAAPVSAFMNPNARGAILGDDPTNGRHFETPMGIPSSEYLYANTWGLKYLYQHTFGQMKGEVTYTCKVDLTYVLKWKIPVPPVPGPGGTMIPQLPIEMTDTENKTYEFTLIPRDYSYWQINNLEVYGLQQATMTNYALPGGAVTLQPSGYTPPAVDMSNSTEVTDHVEPQDTGTITFVPPIVDGGNMRPPLPDHTAELKAIAESQTKEPKVQNDALTFSFEGQSTLVMDDTVVEKNAPAPGIIPAPTAIGDYRSTGATTLYRDRLQIPPPLPNRADTPSEGTIYYELLPEEVGGSGDVNYPITGINEVTVHTPVVNYSTLPDDNRPFDQRMQPDMTRTVLILDRPFTIHMPESGQHVNLPGYGNRDYKAYTKQKRIRFPFGVFHAGSNTYYHGGTWITIPVGTPSMTFKMPTWVDEGNYQIRTEEWAINSIGSEPCEPNRNSQLANYCAVQTFDVGVVGRLFNFRVWDIGDLRFEEVFRTDKGAKAHKPVAYYSGGRDENGEPTALEGQHTWLLPIRPGSHPTQRATVPHNGYPFLFDFKTMGNLWDKGEGIRIDPTFWFVPRSGGTASQVDLYYDASGAGNKMIAVGSAADKKTFTRYYRLADPFRNLSETELQQAAAYEYQHILSASERSAIGWSAFYTQYGKRQTKIGVGYDLEVLPYKSRTLIGPTVIPAGVDATAALRSVQHWYGEYNLPIAPYILPKGTNIVTLANKYGGKLDGHEKEFLTKGYIIVHFAIYTVKNNDQQTEVLGYKAPIANMWAIEGQIAADQNYRGQTFNFKAGDIILFESDFSVRNDFQGQGR
ncbi:bacterial surface protein [Paenibacillus oenotherae]|uniref:Bacterial surface protein n=1 Tax=Paenibacillus oenotherae TaxID=1435645 RepID=A0ABS7D7T5_9BACL|nr:DUF5704 domain-containing protein [Paenibacillus oenotherae]MBW7475223.1 bacterial surface protein [Paenibacillus oenotherae]